MATVSVTKLRQNASEVYSLCRPPHTLHLPESSRLICKMGQETFEKALHHLQVSFVR